MSVKPLTHRRLALGDVDDAIDHYAGEAGPPVVLKFVDALESAYAHIGRHPATGSPRYAQALGLPGLRCWPLKRFPHLVFYVEYEQHLDVWRVLHEQRDIPAWLIDEPSPRTY